jgi:hypothetical protein
MTLSKRQFEVQCKHRLKTGQRTNDVKEYLLGEGMTDSEATNLISKTLFELKKNAVSYFIGGIMLSLIGVLISIALTQGSRGMMVFLWWGPVLVGIILLIVGLLNFIRLTKL